MLRIFIDKEIFLKEISLDDAETIFKLIDSCREYLREWLPFIDATKAPENTEDYIRSLDTKKDPVAVIFFRGETTGLIGFKQTDYLNKKSEIGYWLGERFQGKGIMTRACKAMVDIGFGNLGLNRIQLKTAVGNKKSSAIAKKLGFKFEGIERDGELINGIFHDLEVYSILNENWKTTRLP